MFEKSACKKVSISNIKIFFYKTSQLLKEGIFLKKTQELKGYKECRKLLTTDSYSVLVKVM